MYTTYRKNKITRRNDFLLYAITAKKNYTYYNIHTVFSVSCVKKKAYIAYYLRGIGCVPIAVSLFHTPLTPKKKKSTRPTAKKNKRLTHDYLIPAANTTSKTNSKKTTTGDQ